MLTFDNIYGSILKLVEKTNNKFWDHSSAGRAPALQAGGHRFEPCWSHFRKDVLSQSEMYERENVTVTSSQDAQSSSSSRELNIMAR